MEAVLLRLREGVPEGVKLELAPQLREAVGEAEGVVEVELVLEGV